MWWKLVFGLRLVSNCLLGLFFFFCRVLLFFGLYVGDYFWNVYVFFGFLVVIYVFLLLRCIVFWLMDKELILLWWLLR